MAKARRKTIRIPNATDLALYKADVQKLANLSRWLINIIAGILAVCFTYVVLNHTQVASFVNQAEVGLFYKIGLAIYYSAWVFGAKLDVDIEERVYIRDSARGVLDWKAFGILVIFTMVMAGFFWLHYNERYFAFGLVAFILINIAAWQVLCRRLGVPVADSIKEYEAMNDYFGAEKVRIVDNYVRGDWQKRRFAAMLAMAVVLVALNYALSWFGVADRFGDVQIMDMRIRPFIERGPAMFFLLYIAIAEGWIWAQRINVHHCVNILDDLASKFRLSPKPVSAVAGNPVP